MLPRTTFRVLLAVSILSTACMAQSAPAPCPSANQSADKPCTPPAAPPPSAARQFPFPGETSKPAAPAPNAPKPSGDADHPFPTQAPDMPGADSSSSSSSSSSSNPDTTQPPLNDVGGEGKSIRRKLPKVQKLQTPDERVDEDIRVSKFYLNQENFIGAYMRGKDAVKTEPDYAEAHFSLAQAAQKMKKQDEAKAEFNTYLKLAPDGDNVKAAQKALEELQ